MADPKISAGCKNQTKKKGENFRYNNNNNNNKDGQKKKKCAFIKQQKKNQIK